MRARIRERLAIIWWHRPVLSTNARIATVEVDALTESYTRGYAAGLAEQQPKRVTSTGRTLQFVAGGVA